MGSLNWEKLKPYLPYILAVGAVALLAYFTRKSGGSGGGTSYRLASGSNASPAALPPALSGSGASGVRTLAPSSTAIEPISIPRASLASAFPANVGGVYDGRSAALYNAQSDYQMQSALNREATLREQSRLNSLLGLGRMLTDLFTRQQQQAAAQQKAQQQAQQQTRPQSGAASPGSSAGAGQTAPRSAATQSALERLRRVLAGYRDSVYARNAAAPVAYSDVNPDSFGGLDPFSANYDERYFDWLGGIGQDDGEPIGTVSSSFTPQGFWDNDGRYFFPDGGYYDAYDDAFYY